MLNNLLLNLPPGAFSNMSILIIFICSNLDQTFSYTQLSHWCENQTVGEKK